MISAKYYQLLKERQAMIRALLFSYALMLFCASTAAQVKIDAEKDCLRIIQISDVQLGFTYAYAQQNNITEILADSSNRYIDHQYFKMAVSEINHLNPDIIVNTGDLVHDASDTSMINNYQEIASGFKAPVYIAMGNHDGWNASEIELFRQKFRQNDYYSYRIRNCLFIFLNSWHLKYPGRDTLGTMKQKDFIQNTLAQNADAEFKIMLFHIPVYMNSPQEEEAHSSIPISERNWLLDLALKNRVKLFLSGHAHQNSVQIYRDSLTLITTGPIAYPLGQNSDGTPSERGFRIIDINLKNGSINQKFIPLTLLEPKTFLLPEIDD